MTSTEDLVRQVLATGLVAVFPWLAEQRGAEVFMDAVHRREIDVADATELTALAMEMSEDHEIEVQG